jgi:hypothetical protein
LNVATDAPDVNYSLVEIPYEDCSIELFETEGGNSVLDHLRRIQHTIFMDVLQLKVPMIQADSHPIECRFPVVTQYLGNQNPYTNGYSLPQVSLCESIFSEDDFTDAIRYYLSWHCIKVVISYQTIVGEQHEEIVCGTGNISSQDMRYCLYIYVKEILRYMHKHEQCTLRIYIGSVDNVENIIAVDFSTCRDEDGEHEHDIMYLTSPKLSAMTKSDITQHFRTHIREYLHEETEMQDRIMFCIKDVISKMPPPTDVESVVIPTDTETDTA